MKYMNLVMDDFHHAHAHSLRLMCIEECGEFFANSYVGDYALTRTGNTEETRNGDVTRTITGNVNESIENGSVTINNNLMAKKTTEVISGNQDYVATVSGNVTETSTITGNYTQLITAATASTTVSGNLNWIKSAESQFVSGMCTELFGGVKAIANSGFVSDLYRGGKYENHAGILINDGKTKNESINVTINNYSQTLVVKTNVSITNAKLTMVC